jgi:hypothetical protein
MSTICMKLDPGMHIDLHLVFFGKTGVTGVGAGVGVPPPFTLVPVGSTKTKGGGGVCL